MSKKGEADLSFSFFYSYLVTRLLVQLRSDEVLLRMADTLAVPAGMCLFHE